MAIGSRHDTYAERDHVETWAASMTGIQEAQGSVEKRVSETKVD